METLPDPRDPRVEITCCTCDAGIDGRLLWSCRAQGRFPEIEVLKQKVRDAIAREHDLGHSDRKRDGQDRRPVTALGFGLGALLAIAGPGGS
ncbi:MAG TPA: hypothetical protein VIX81_05725 [Gammaproteobacteria bacterium]